MSDQIQFFCPHCGQAMKMTLGRDIPKDIICDLCGSSIIEAAKEALKQVKGGLTVAQPRPNQAIMDDGMMPSLPPVDSESLAFPPSQIVRNTQTPFIPQKPQPSQEQSTVELVFTQLKQRIPIPSNQNVFHFGRNLIFPLVDANQYDVEFLNSISRIKQDDKTGAIIGEHFIITKDNKSNYYIEDRNSKWGTWLNRTQIKGKGKIKLKKGDKIEIALSKPGVKTVFPMMITFNM